MSNSLRPHGLQHTQLPGRSSSPGVCSNSCPLSQRCLPIISSSVAPFASCPQSFPASGSLATSYWRSAWGASHPWVSGMSSLIRWHVLVGQGSSQTHSPSGSCWITSFSCSESWARGVCGSACVVKSTSSFCRPPVSLGAEVTRREGPSLSVLSPLHAQLFLPTGGPELRRDVKPTAVKETNSLQRIPQQLPLLGKGRAPS